MTAADLDAVAAIEARTPHPWSREQLAAQMHSPAGWGLIVLAGSEAAVAGYVCGAAVADEAEIHRLAVAENLRRRGLGRMLVAGALERLRTDGIRRCWLEVRASNAAALALYGRIGFYRTGIRKKYYRSPEEDALVLRFDMDPQ
ncbi:MAG: ribosomal protein S18-alanine N-acetyltransferase [Thermodesulfobacteriota bacterium]